MIEQGGDLDLCVRLLTDLAWLRVAGRAPHALRLTDELSLPEAAKRVYTQTLVDLESVRPEGQWAHAPLIRAVVRELNYALPAIWEVQWQEGISEQLRESADIAERVANRINNCYGLASLAHVVFGLTCGVTPQVSLATYEQAARNVAWVMTGEERATDATERVKAQLYGWAGNAEPHRSLAEVLSDLSEACPDLTPALPIVTDLAARMMDRILLPFFCDKADVPFGLLLPATVTLTEPNAPDAAICDLFRAPVDLCLVGANEDESNIEKSFRDGVKRGVGLGRTLLQEYGQGRLGNLSVHIALPPGLSYSGGSSTLPVALAFFIQSIRIRNTKARTLALNPEVVTTGPTDEEALEAKTQALMESIGDGARMIAQPADKIVFSSRNVYLWRGTNRRNLVRRYLRENDLEQLASAVSPVLSFGTSRVVQPWEEQQTYKNEKRFLQEPAQAEYVEMIRATLQAKSVLQIRGLPGIGKTWIIAQFLAQAADNLNRDSGDRDFDLLLYTSVDVPARKAEVPTRWSRDALRDLRGKLGWYGLGGAGSTSVDATTAEDIINDICASLRGMRVLWVVDDGQYLVNDDKDALEEQHFRTLVNMLLSGDMGDNHRLIFVAHHELKPDVNNERFGSLYIEKGFSDKIAYQFLRKSGVFGDEGGHRDPEIDFLLHRILGLLHGHPRSLAFLAGFVNQIRPAYGPTIQGEELQAARDQLRALAHELEVGSNEQEFREKNADLMFKFALDALRDTNEELFQVLSVASTFRAYFDMKLLGTVLRGIDRKNFAEQLDRPLQRLCQWSFLSRAISSTTGLWHWSMHGLVRDRTQDLFAKESPDQFRNAHIHAGKIFFPLGKDGHGIHNPIPDVRTRLENTANRDTALYHYSVADDENGLSAIRENLYEREVPHARELLESARTLKRPKFARNAERLLRKVIATYLPLAGGDLSLDQARELPWDVNRLMGLVLLEPTLSSKHKQAAIHLEAASEKHPPVTTVLLRAWCSIIGTNDVGAEALWALAKSRFEEVRASASLVGTMKPAFGEKYYESLGSAYAAMAECAIGRSEPEVAAKWLEQAAAAGFPWTPLYAIGLRLSKTGYGTWPAETWYEKAFEIPYAVRNADLWKEYVLDKARERQSQDGIFASITQNLLETRRGRNLLETRRGPIANLVIANALIDSGREEDAISFARLNLEQYPNHDDAYLLIGKIIENKWNKREPEDKRWLIKAREVYEQGIERAGNDGQLYIALGRLLEASGDEADVAKARKVYEQGIERAGNDGQLYIALGRLLEASGDEADVAKVRAIYEQGIERASSDGKLYIALGRLLEASGDEADVVKARKVYEQGIERASNDNQLYIALGRLLEASGDEADVAKVRAIYEQGIERAGNDNQLYIALGRLLEASGDEADVAKVRAIYEQGIERASNDANLYYEIGRYFQNASDFSSAEAWYRRGLIRWPKDPNLQIGLVRTISNLGRKEEAKDIYNALINKEKRWTTLYCDLYLILMEEGRDADAKAVIVEGLKACDSTSLSYQKLIELSGNL